MVGEAVEAGEEVPLLTVCSARCSCSGLSTTGDVSGCNVGMSPLMGDDTGDTEIVVSFIAIGELSGSCSPTD